MLPGRLKNVPRGLGLVPLDLGGGPEPGGHVGAERTPVPPDPRTVLLPGLVPLHGLERCEPGREFVRPQAGPVQGREDR